jgi:hypothetical protein
MKKIGTTREGVNEGGRRESEIWRVSKNQEPHISNLLLSYILSPRGKIFNTAK